MVIWAREVGECRRSGLMAPASTESLRHTIRAGDVAQGRVWVCLACTKPWVQYAAQHNIGCHDDPKVQLPEWYSDKDTLSSGVRTTGWMKCTRKVLRYRLAYKDTELKPRLLE